MYLHQKETMKSVHKFIHLQHFRFIVTCTIRLSKVAFRNVLFSLIVEPTVKTRMHSSRMLTACSLPYGGSLSRGIFVREVSLWGRGFCQGDPPDRDRLPPNRMTDTQV